MTGKSGVTVSLGSVWDRTTDVLRGRAGIIAPIATLAIFLPNVVSAALTSYGSKGSVATALLMVVVAFAVVAATFWGTLAIIAVATHPATTRADAQAQATRRLPAAIGVVLALSAILSLAVIPLIVAIAGTGVNFSDPRAAASLSAANVSGGLAAFITLYVIALLIGAFWLSARIFLLNPVILNERRGLGAVIRSVELTRGMTWKLVGLLILLAVVVLVPTAAVQSVVGVVVRLVLGENGIATAQFVGAVAGAAVTTAFSAAVAVFQAQFYVAVTERAATERR